MIDKRELNKHARQIFLECFNHHNRNIPASKHGITHISIHRLTIARLTSRNPLTLILIPSPQSG